MPIHYMFKDSKTSDTVAKALLFVAKFSKKHALVKFSDSSVGVVWGGSPKSYYIHAEATALDMFKNKNQLHHCGIDHCSIIQVDPTILGRTLKGNTQDRNVTIVLLRPNNKLRIIVEHVDTAKRTIVHTIPCDFKTLDDYKLMLIEEMEQNHCLYDTMSYVDNIHRLKHILDSFVKLNTPRIYIWSKSSEDGNDLTISTRTQGSNVNVSLSDLDNGYADREDRDYILEKPRQEAGVYIDTKKLAFFLSNLLVHKRSRVSFEIEQNKCVKITLDNEIAQGEKFYQSLLLLHSLNS